MDNEHTRILQPDELRQEMKDNSAVIAGALNDQWITLQLLSGKIPTGIDIHSQLFTDMLGQLASQGGISGEQLAQSQQYDAAMLESAALSALTLDILSGDVKGMVDKMSELVKCGGQISTGLAQMGGNGGDSVNSAASTLFGGIGALGSVGQAGEKLSDLGTKMGFAGKAVGLLGGFLTGPVAPLLLGGVALAGIGAIGYKAYKNHMAKQENTADPEFETQVMEATSYENMAYKPDEPLSWPERERLTERDMMDPDSVRYHRLGVNGTPDIVQNPPTGAATPAPYDRLEPAEAGLIAEMSALRQEICKLVEKPFDPNVRAEVVIQSLRANMTYREFEEAIEKKFKDDLQVSSMPMW